MTGFRWVTVIALVAAVLASLVMLSNLRGHLVSETGRHDLHAMTDEQLALLRSVVGAPPPAPCDPALPVDSLPDETRKRCNRYYLAVVKAARSLGYEGTRIRDVRDLRFYPRFVEGF